MPDNLAVNQRTIEIFLAAPVYSYEQPYLSGPPQERNALEDGFPHAVAVALRIALAFCVSLFVFAVMGGWF